MPLHLPPTLGPLPTSLAVLRLALQQLQARKAVSVLAAMLALEIGAPVELAPVLLGQDRQPVVGAAGPAHSMVLRRGSSYAI